MHSTITKTAVLSAMVLGAGLFLSGCVQEHLSSDFGSAVRQDMAAQIADPDARYVGEPAPGSNGARVSLALDRYQKGKVIPPSGGTASTIGAGPGAAAPTLPQ